ncbi:MAG: type II toxin-antitoxin system RelE/ParE family toxin [Alphaproteobacteria bacterium]|nr:type II toxin-antitoxin system RelE/ParE family toxin [Alphaproteobacteria bacterium]
MIWKIEYAKSVQKSVRKLDRQTQSRLRKYFETRLAVADDPRSLGRPLQGSKFQNLWRFRVGDYRIIAQIEDDTVRILVLRIGHRREVYR